MRWKLLVLVPVALVVLLVGGVLLYTKVIAGHPPRRLAFTDSTSTVSAGGGSTSSSAPATGAEADPGASTGSIDGTWKVVAPSKAGYRAKEILFGQGVTAVGRTDAVTGDLSIQGTTVGGASFTVDLTMVTSDRSQRDGQFRNRIMETSRYPTARFTLTAPISFGALPADKTEITVQASGRLTLKDRTNDVTFALKARRNGPNIEVNGTIPVTFSDYGIDNPSGGPAQVGNEGEVEVLLVFARAA